jgi:hypothetical protein
LCGGDDVAGSGAVVRLPSVAGRWIGHANPSRSLSSLSGYVHFVTSKLA